MPQKIRKKEKVYEVAFQEGKVEKKAEIYCPIEGCYWFAVSKLNEGKQEKKISNELTFRLLSHLRSVHKK